MPTGHAHPNDTERQYHRIFDAASDGLVILDLETGRVLAANPAACRMHGCARQEFIDQPVTAFIHPDSQNLFTKYMQAFQSGGSFDPRALHLRRDGSTFYAEWRGAALTYQDRPCLLGSLRDVSQRISAEQALKKRVETRTHEQAKLLEISHTLASTLEFQPGLILDQLREIVAYAQGGLFALQDTTLVSLAMRGAPQLEQIAPLHIYLKYPESLPILFNEHRPVTIPDIWGESSPATLLRSLLKDAAAGLLSGMQSWMWVPLAVSGRIIGCIGVADAKKNTFTAHDASLALSVANQAAIAMINAELNRQAQTLAVLEERQRLARDLHDAINQSLFSAGLIAEVLPRLWDRDQAEARRSLEDLRRLVRGAQAEMRALLAELRPTTLTDANLGDLLYLLSNALTGRSNIPVTVNAAGDFRLPGAVQVAFYRICQEAFFNIAKHSKASQVELDLCQVGAAIEMRIHDNGQGFDPAHITTGHYGLGMMRERAGAVGATLTVASQPGLGAELTLRWTPPATEELL